jgi:hypothetical protein
VLTRCVKASIGFMVLVLVLLNVDYEFYNFL